MLRWATLTLTLLAMALPASALAQSAGDNQYQDPFGNTTTPKKSKPKLRAGQLCKRGKHYSGFKCKKDKHGKYRLVKSR